MMFKMPKTQWNLHTLLKTCLNTSLWYIYWFMNMTSGNSLGDNHKRDLVTIAEREVAVRMTANQVSTSTCIHNSPKLQAILMHHTLRDSCVVGQKEEISNRRNIMKTAGNTQRIVRRCICHKICKNLCRLKIYHSWREMPGKGSLVAIYKHKHL